MTPNEARTLAHEMRAQGKNLSEIADELAKRGYRSSRTGKPILQPAVSYLLATKPTVKGNNVRDDKKKEPLPAPSYMKVDQDTPPPPAAPKPQAAKAPTDSIMVIIARPGQLKEIAGDFFK